MHSIPHLPAGECSQSCCLHMVLLVQTCELASWCEDAYPVETSKRPGWRLGCCCCLHSRCQERGFSCVPQNTAFCCCMPYSLWPGEALTRVLSSMHVSNLADLLCWKLSMCLSALPFFFIREPEHLSKLQRFPSDLASA